MPKQPPTPDEYARMYWTQQQQAVRLLNAQRAYLRTFETNLLAEFKRRLDSAAAHINEIHGDPEAIRRRQEADAEVAAHHRKKRAERQRGHDTGRIPH